MSAIDFFRKPLPGIRLVLIAAGCLGGLLLGMGAYTFHLGKGMSYFSNDPQACVNCHVMNDHYASWTKSSHHAVATCNDCHLPEGFFNKWVAKGIHGWNHSKAFTTGVFDEPIRSKPRSFQDLQNNCVRCHGELAGHIGVSQGPAEGEVFSCTRCHGNVAHGASRGL